MKSNGLQEMAGEVAEIRLMTQMDARGSQADGLEASLGNLIARAQAGDRGAFDEIMISHQKRVIKTAWRLLGDQEDARDATQEVFFRAFKYLRGFRGEQDFAGWIYRIVVNVCRDIARKRRRRQITSLESELKYGSLAVLAGPQDVEAEVLLAQERAIIDMALDSLTRKERLALVLRDLEGLTTEEVAEVLGTSQVTVRSQICSARVKIKRYRDEFLKRTRRE